MSEPREQEGFEKLDGPLHDRLFTPCRVIVRVAPEQQEEVERSVLAFGGVIHHRLTTLSALAVELPLACVLPLSQHVAVRSLEHEQVFSIPEQSVPADAGSEETEEVDVPVSFLLNSLANVVAAMQRETVGSAKHRQLKREAQAIMSTLERSVADLNADLARLRTVEAERDRLREALGDVIRAVESGRCASIGSIGNTYCPQIAVSRVEQWRAALTPTSTREPS